MTWVSRLGFAPRDFWFFRWERLILSALVTSGGITSGWPSDGRHYQRGGGMEDRKPESHTHLLGRAPGHPGARIDDVLCYRYTSLASSRRWALFFSRDVGPSAGYMGSLGLITTFLPKPWRWIAFGATYSS